MHGVATFLRSVVCVISDWIANGYIATGHAARWFDNVKILRALCSGKNDTPGTPDAIEELHFSVINQVEQILSDIEAIANDRSLYCSEPICGGEPYYALC